VKKVKKLKKGARGSRNDRFEFVRRERFQRLNFPSRAMTWGRFFDICIQGRKITTFRVESETRVSVITFPGSRTLEKGDGTGTD
jgi:hypothetical protein